ncbi:hypothetical protein [Flavobacterium sp. ASV13]|uniref:hypothetical protein n=1 Tax=Flavobacterium sp. ASV13 TaxID=1506583 RepID=UPI001269497F|nr:hypothetical protein [Flavobacterium sp. ASV13]
MIEIFNFCNYFIMLKTILNFNGVEVLTRNQQQIIFGGQTVAQCKNWAPAGANPAIYPNYPCAEIYEPVEPLEPFEP